MSVALALFLLGLGDEPGTLMARAAAATRAEPRCTVDPHSTDVTVCGMRRADRYRVPFVVRDPGDPRYESVSAERQRLFARTTPVEDMGPFLVGGGMAGVSATIGSDGSTQARPLAK